MIARFVKTFKAHETSAQNYEAATRWCYAGGYTPAIRFVGHTGACVLTLEGDDAIRAIEADTKAKVVVEEAV